MKGKLKNSEKDLLEAVAVLNRVNQIVSFSKMANQAKKEITKTKL